MRAGGAEAAGRLGALSVVPPLHTLLGDADPMVRVAAIRGLTAMALRLGRPDLASERVGPLAEDADPAVKQAATTALASLA